MDKTNHPACMYYEIDANGMATEVQTSFVPSQNFTMLMKIEN